MAKGSKTESATTAEKPVPAPTEPAQAANAPEPDDKEFADKVKKYLRGEITGDELDGTKPADLLAAANVAYGLYEQGRYKEAKVIFQGLTSYRPKEAYFHTALGAVCLALEEIDEALAALDQAVAHDPKNLAALVNRGEAYLRKQEPLKAAEDLKVAVDLDPEGKTPMARRARGLAAAAVSQLVGLDASAEGEPAKNPAEQPAAPKAKAKTESKPAAKAAARKK